VEAEHRERDEASLERFIQPWRLTQPTPAWRCQRLSTVRIRFLRKLIVEVVVPEKSVRVINAPMHGETRSSPLPRQTNNNRILPLTLSMG
jgi:hypothetical protein